MSAPIPLCDTTGMSRKRWLECRMHGPKGDIPYTVGGSDIAAIFGVSPVMSLTADTVTTLLQALLGACQSSVATFWIPIPNCLSLTAKAE